MLKPVKKAQELEKVYNSMPIVNENKLVLISQLFKNMSDIIIKNKLNGIKKAKPEYYLKKYVEENLGNPF